MDLTERQKAYCEAVEANLEGVEAVSSGLCPGCDDCADTYGYESTEAMDEACEAGEAYDEASFSWSPCGVCGCHLGGDRHIWHFIIPDDNGSCKGQDIHHESDMCTDCVMFIANGDVPEDEYLDWID